MFVFPSMGENRVWRESKIINIRIFVVISILFFRSHYSSFFIYTLRSFSYFGDFYFFEIPPFLSHLSFVNLIFLRFIIWEKFISNLNLVFLIFYFRQQLLRLRKLRWWAAIQMMLWRVTWGAHDYGDMGSLTKCIWMPGIHRTAMWFLSFVQLFGWQESVFG